MANQIDGGTQKQGAVSGIDQELRTQKDKLHRDEPGRDGRLDKERERLEPGQNAEGTGGAGSGPDTPSDGNSNT